MTSVEQPTRSFSLELPDGFVELPSDVEAATPERIGAIGARFAALAGLPPDDPNAAEAAVYYAAVGATSGDEGVDYTGMALYRSPDDPARFMMVLLSSLCVPASHVDVESAVAGLLEVHRAAGQGEVGQIDLPAGPAVTVVTEQLSGISDGEQSAQIRHRAITAWVPDPGGTTLGVVSVSSNNWVDWPHIARLAVDILRTMRWDDET
ncbi:MAG TPA: hypothetical protein VJX10_20620 [Pseudonocardiaceae bacterium]|nr:hypothetical protein [Pseudonocardiaceae bacterium]